MGGLLSSHLFPTVSSIGIPSSRLLRKERCFRSFPRREDWRQDDYAVVKTPWDQLIMITLMIRPIAYSNILQEMHRVDIGSRILLWRKEKNNAKDNWFCQEKRREHISFFDRRVKEYLSQSIRLVSQRSWLRFTTGRRKRACNWILFLYFIILHQN